MYKITKALLCNIELHIKSICFNDLLFIFIFFAALTINFQELKKFTLYSHQCACMYNCIIFKTEKNKTKLTKASAAGALSNISPLDTYI